MQPTEIKLRQKQRQLVLSYEDGSVLGISCADLRANSPSAEAKPETTKDVNIVSIEPVGHYAVKLIFDDGHETGIYSWELLYELAKKLGTATPA